MCIRSILLVLILSVMSVAGPAHAADVAPLRAERLRVDALVDPVAAPRAAPTLSWIVTGDGFDRRQTAYQVIASSSWARAADLEGDLWDSGRIESAESLHCRYDGRTPEPGAPVFWRVRVWDEAGAPSAWSAIATFGVPLPPESWRDVAWIGFDDVAVAEHVHPLDLGAAQWITTTDDLARGAAGASWYRTRFDVSETAITRATLRVTADDRYECFVNGIPIAHGRNWRDAESIDLTDMLQAGACTIDVIVTNDAPGPYGLLARLHIAHADGSAFDRVSGDGTWQAVIPAEGLERAAARALLHRKRPIRPDETGAVRIVGGPTVLPWGNGLRESPTEVMRPARALRRTFRSDAEVVRATLHVAALGFADVSINGARVTDRFGAEWTDYRRRVCSLAYDVTEHVRAGENALGITLADGWYCGYLGYGKGREHYGPEPRVAVQLHLEHADGTRHVITSDDAWRGHASPVRYADMFMGECIDRTHAATDGFDRTGFDDATWEAVDTGLTHPAPHVAPTSTVPIGAFEQFAPISITPRRDGSTIVNFGRNIAGVIRLRVDEAPGTVIRVRYGERLNPDGSLYTDNLRFARATDTFICRGDGPEVFEPRFTFHGFQYAEIEGVSRLVEPDAVTAIALGSRTPLVGTFECSSDLLTQLAANVYWTQRANFLSVPTDCPQRDERLGWTGDAQVYVRTAGAWCDVQAFFRKWLRDLADATRDDGCVPKFAPVIETDGGADGGPAWADAATIVPWAMYRMYDDVELLERAYPMMRAHVEFNRRRATAERRPPASYHAYGDWLDVQDPTPKDVIFMAYWAESTRIVADAAARLGKHEDHARYARLREEIIAAFNAGYVDSDGRVAGGSQTAYVLALRYVLLDDATAERAAGHLVEAIEARGRHLSTGFIGTKDLMLVLAEIGRHDLAYALALNETYPSWGFTIRHGATSIWERWDGWTPERGFQDVGMNSFAHYAFGAVYQWMLERIGGVQIVEPGYRRFRVAPVPGGGLTHASVVLHSVRGRIESAWRIEGDGLIMHVTVPANTTCALVVPTSDPASIEINGARRRAVDGDIMLGSGRYRITARR